MGAKGQKHFGDQAQKRTKKKPDRSKAGAGGGRSSRGEEGGKRKHLDSMTVSYFRRVSERLNEGFTNDEERGKRENQGQGRKFFFLLSCNI